MLYLSKRTVITISLFRSLTNLYWLVANVLQEGLLHSLPGGWDETNWAVVLLSLSLILFEYELILAFFQALGAISDCYFSEVIHSNLTVASDNSPGIFLGRNILPSPCVLSLFKWAPAWMSYSATISFTKLCHWRRDGNPESWSCQ